MSVETNPLYTGQDYVECTICHRRKCPQGRSAPMESRMCDFECPGYPEVPRPGDLWPGERREDFGFPEHMAKTARELRAKENEAGDANPFSQSSLDAAWDRTLDHLGGDAERVLEGARATLETAPVTDFETFPYEDIEADES